MRKGILLAGGAGLGAGLMYVLDPERGRRRRAALRDHATHVIHVAPATLDKKARHLAHRARGLAAKAGAALRRREVVSDRLLEDRVRSQLGRVVSEPRDVEVLADEGHVTLRGVVRAREAERLLRRVARVRGVRGVESQLNVKGRHGGHEAGVENNGKVGAGHPRRGMSATARLLATVVGGGLTFYGTRRKGVVGSLAGVLGMKMLSRAS